MFVSKPISILVIEDSVQDFLILKEYISRIESFQVEASHAASVEDARIQQVERSFDLVFLDLFLPDSYGRETFINVSALFSDVPIVVLSGMIDKNLALSIVQMGAQDFIVKGDFDETLIEKSITYSIERHKNQKRLEQSEKRYRLTFKNAGVAITEYDATEHFQFIEQLKIKGEDISCFDDLTRDQCDEIRKRIIINSVNPELLRMFGFQSKEDFVENRYKMITDDSADLYRILSRAIWERKRFHKSINIYKDIAGKELTVFSRFTIYDYENGSCKIVRSGTDISALKEKEELIETQRVLSEKLSKASMELLVKGKPEDRLKQSFKTMADSLGTDVISLLKTEQKEGEFYFKKIHRWVSDKYAEDKKYLKLLEIPLSKFLFDNDFNEIERRRQREFHFESQSQSQSQSQSEISEFFVVNGVKSLLLTPILQNNKTWAFLNFVSKENSKKWTEEERLIIQSYSSAVGSFLIKTEAERELYELNNELESRIEERTGQLTEALTELESFSYSVSHDLRAPLRKVAGFSQILDKEFSNELPERAVHLLSNIKSGATEMTHLIHDLLEFSKLGRQSISLNEIPMNSICEGIVKDALESNPRLNINVKLPKLHNAWGDVTLVKHVLNNLVWNAVKFSSKRDKIQIEFDCTEHGDYYHYSIKDNGIGIDMKYAHKVFAVFQRLHTKDEYEGTGVGLAIVNRIIKKHGGEVNVHGELDKGCTFIFSLPKNKDVYKDNNQASSENELEISLKA